MVKELLARSDDHAGDGRQQIVFLGSCVEFPDCLLRLVKSEIADKAVLRLDGAAALRESIGHRPGLLSLVLVHETSWDHLGPGIFEAMQDRGFMLAIAYRDPARVVPILQSDDPRIRHVGFLPTEVNVDSLLNILRLMLTGYPFIANDVMARLGAIPAEGSNGQAEGAGSDLARNRLRAQTQAHLEKLTPREHEVLSLVAEGLQNKHIADALSLSEHTVKLHLHHVISKLGARNRTDAAKQFLNQRAN